MTDLRRTKVGEFTLKDSILLEDLENNDKIYSIEQILKNYPTIEVDNNLEFKIKNGCKIPNTYNQEYIVFKNKEKVLGLYKNEDGILKPYKMFVRS